MGVFHVYFILNTLFRSSSEELDDVAEYIFKTAFLSKSSSKEELNHFQCGKNDFSSLKKHRKILERLLLTEKLFVEWKSAYYYITSFYCWKRVYQTHEKHKSCLYRNTEINRIKYHINLFGNDDLIDIMKIPKYFAVTLFVMPILGANEKDKEHTSTFFISILIIVLIKKAFLVFSTLLHYLF